MSTHTSECYLCFTSPKSASAVSCAFASMDEALEAARDIARKPGYGAISIKCSDGEQLGWEAIAARLTGRKG